MGQHKFKDKPTHGSRQFETTGICKECIRHSYCNKLCRAAKERVKSELFAKLSAKGITSINKEMASELVHQENIEI